MSSVIPTFTALTFVRLAPEPLNTVADNVPVEGTYWYLVELVYSVDNVPLVTAAKSGYRVDAVVVSSVTVIAAVGVVQLGAPEALDVKTCPEVPAAVNA